MIHSVELPDTTYEILKEVVKLQMLLLYAAASKEEIYEENCKRYLQEHDISPNRSKEIVTWLWRSAERYSSLEEFAKGPGVEKLKLVERLERETWILLDNPVGFVQRMPDEHAWQRNGADFLRRFYFDFSKSGLPTSLFTEEKKGCFSRQDFLAAFIAKNNGLHVCPVCDESGFYTISQKTIRSRSQSVVYSEIEHYLPQSLYPHFACHPYNLVPICHICNSPTHGDVDPLQPDEHQPDYRLPLEYIALPYRSKGLGSLTYLGITFDVSNGVTAFTNLKPRESNPDITLNEQITSLDRVYKIPERWNKNLEVDKVGETLFRRMRQFLRGTYELPMEDNFERVVLSALDQLLYYLHEKEKGDYGKDPFAFAMIWLLAAIIAEEDKSLAEVSNDGNSAETPSWSLPLMEEVSRWLGHDIKNKGEYVKVAEMLRKIVNQQIPSISS